MTVKSFQIGSQQEGLSALEKSFKIGPDKLFLIAGPCVIESREICLRIVENLKEISQRLQIDFIFKASFDKANRSSSKSFRGPGLEQGLSVLGEIRDQFQVPVLTDVHETWQVKPIAEVVDVLQVPAFLCRQSDLLYECGDSKRVVNIKKGQFMSPNEMRNVIEKVTGRGSQRVIVTERGTFFGYNRLVNDMSGIEIMKSFGVNVVFDATHSVQQPGGLGNASGGASEMTPVLAKAAVAAGAGGLFLEVHPEPEKALSDSGCIMKLNAVERLLVVCREIFEVVRS